MYSIACVGEASAIKSSLIPSLNFWAIPESANNLSLAGIESSEPE
jgi:hypothetical protein